VVLVGELSMFFDLTFVVVCLALATLVRRSDFWTVGLLPPLLMIAVFGFLALVARDAIADPRDNTVQAVVSGVAHHSAALLAGYALCLGCLAWRAHGEVVDVLG
jgi:ABC-type transport system involved in cytochrome c biogenesis permease subunit